MSAVDVAHRVDGRRPTRRSSCCCPTRSAPRRRCGTRRCRRWPSGTAWSATTPAATASRRRPPGRTRSTTSATTWSRCSTGSGSSGRTSAGCRSAGWTAMRLAVARAGAGRPARAVLHLGDAGADQRLCLDRAATVRPAGTGGGRRRRRQPLAHARHAAEHPDLVARLQAMIARPGRGLRRLLRGGPRRWTCAPTSARITAPTLVVAGARGPGPAAGAPERDRRRASPAPAAHRRRRRPPGQPGAAPARSPAR